MEEQEPACVSRIVTRASETAVCACIRVCVPRHLRVHAEHGRGNRQGRCAHVGLLELELEAQRQKIALLAQ